MNKIKTFNLVKYFYIGILDISLFIFFFPFGFGWSCFGCSGDQINNMFAGKITNFLVGTDMDKEITILEYFFKLFLIIMASSLIFIIWAYYIDKNEAKKMVISFYGEIFISMIILFFVCLILFNF